MSHRLLLLRLLHCAALHMHGAHMFMNTREYVSVCERETEIYIEGNCDWFENKIVCPGTLFAINSLLEMISYKACSYKYETTTLLLTYYPIPSILQPCRPLRTREHCFVH